MKYFKKHPTYVAAIYLLGGIGYGILLARPMFSIHPVRWGIVFIGLAVAGYLYGWYASRS